MLILNPLSDWNLNRMIFHYCKLPHNSNIIKHLIKLIVNKHHYNYYQMNLKIHSKN